MNNYLIDEILEDVMDLLDIEEVFIKVDEQKLTGGGFGCLSFSR